MPNYFVEFDQDGDSSSDLARIWSEAALGDRTRITRAAFAVERILAENPDLGTTITNGKLPTVKFMDYDILRVFFVVEYMVVTIVGFQSNF